MFVLHFSPFGLGTRVHSEPGYSRLRAGQCSDRGAAHLPGGSDCAGCRHLFRRRDRHLWRCWGRLGLWTAGTDTAVPGVPAVPQEALLPPPPGPPVCRVAQPNRYAASPQASLVGLAHGYSVCNTFFRVCFFVKICSPFFRFGNDKLVGICSFFYCSFYNKKIFKIV